MKLNNMPGKKIVFLLLINLISLAAAAQFKLTLILSPTPPARLSEWAARRDVLTLLVNNGQATGGSINAKIKTEIKTTDGTVIGTTDLARARTISFVNVNTVLTAVDVLPLENMIFAGKYKNTLDKTGKLPADNYMLCVQMVRPVDYAPLSEPVCKNFYVASLQLPVLMKPYDNEVIDVKIAQTAVIFRWSPVVPAQSTVVTYRIQVFEILDYQQPMQALRSNQPLLDKEIRGATQYIWQPQLGLLTGKDITDTAANKKYINTSEDNLGSGKASFIWTIQTLDANGDPIVQTEGNGEARSEPRMFVMSTHSHR